MFELHRNGEKEKKKAHEMGNRVSLYIILSGGLFVVLRVKYLHRKKKTM